MDFAQLLPGPKPSRVIHRTAVYSPKAVLEP